LKQDTEAGNVNRCEEQLKSSNNGYRIINWTGIAAAYSFFLGVSFIMAKVPINLKISKGAGVLHNQAIVANGMVYCSGQLPANLETGELVLGDIKQNTVRIFRYSKGLKILGH